MRFSELSSEINFASNRVASSAESPLLGGRLSLYKKVSPEDRAKLKTGNRAGPSEAQGTAGFSRTLTMLNC